MIVRSFLLVLTAIVLSTHAQERPTTPPTRSATPIFAPVQTSVTPTPPAINPDKLTDAPEIARQLAIGSAQVIVTLSPPAALARTDFASRASLDALRPQIQQLQQNVLDRFPVVQVKAGHRFENIPGFSAEISADGLKALQAHPLVVSIEPVHILQPHLAQGIALMHGMTYRSTYNGAGLSIAICDSGVDYNHPRLGGGGFPNSKVIGGYNFGDGNADPIPDQVAHGTACAGIAAGDLGTVGDYIGGVAYNAKLYALKITSGSGGSASTADMVAAWDWCVTHKNDNPSFPIMVISTSFGGGRYFATCDTISASMTTAANNAVAAGMTLLVSSGNEGYCDSIAWPACISSVISVGAVYDASFGHYYPCIESASCAPKISSPLGCETTKYYADDITAADKVTSYANVASFLTLLAPANQCYTLDISGAAGYSSGDYYDAFGGTSASCPYAAGAVACLQSAAKALTGNYLTPAQVKSRLTSLGDNVTDTKVAITKPRVNLERVIQSFGTNPVLNFVSATLIGGNGNQSVDPNECSELRVVVRNDGPSAATNIIATLSTSTPGASVVQSSSAYVNLAGNATGTNLTPFQLSTSPSFVCGTPINLTLVLTYAGGTNIDSFGLVSGDTNYTVTQSSGAAIFPGTTDIGNHGNSSLTTIPLPFAYKFYGQTFSNATLSSDGYLQFSSSVSSSANSCLPVSSFTNTIFAFWENLRTDGSIGAAQGVYTSTSGAAPNRIFNIEWRASYSQPAGKGNPVNFEVRLYENSSRFDLVYGALNGNGSGATVGAQDSATGPFTQFECNTGGLSAGLQLAFQTLCVDGGGCGSPLANFTGGPTSGIGPLTVSFTNLSSGASTYNWNFGDGIVSATVNPSNVYTHAGSYNVKLTAINALGSNSLTRTNYIVVSPPPPVASFVANVTNGLVPLSVNFTNLSSGATNYIWNFGNGQTSSTTNATGTYTNAGSYTVTLSAVGLGGTNVLARTNYIVATNPPPPVVNFIANPTNGTSPLTVVFTNLSSGAASYVWDFGDNQSSTTPNPTNTYTNAGTYTVTLSAVGAGGTNVLTRTNYIVATNLPPPVADFAASPTNGASPLTVIFTNLSSGAASYVWNFGDNQSSTAANPTNTYTNAGSYTVSLTALGMGGSNTLTRSNYIIAIIPAQLIVLPTSLDFSLIAPNASAQAALVVSNAGSAILEGTAVVPEGPFTIVSGTPYSLMQSGTTNLVIHFLPTVPGAFSNTVIFTSNGGTSTNVITGRAAESPLIVSLNLSNSDFTFSFETIPGLDYEVQYTDSLNDPLWQTLQSVAGDGTIKTMTNSVSETSHRFYRLMMQ